MSSYFAGNGNAAEARMEYFAIVCEAFESGFSLMEIARITGGTRAEFFYSILRNSGLVASMPRGRSPKVDLPEQIALVFKQKGLSFPKWCHVWGFNTEVARLALQVDEPDNDDKTYEIHRAFRRDFPDRYSYIYPDSQLCSEEVVRLKTGLISPDIEQLVSVSWCKEVEKYIASLYGEDGIEGVGESWSEAVKDLEQVWWIHKGATRLKHALSAKCI